MQQRSVLLGLFLNAADALGLYPGIWGMPPTDTGESKKHPE